jgi:hypothetical protein
MDVALIGGPRHGFTIERMPTGASLIRGRIVPWDGASFGCAFQNRLVVEREGTLRWGGEVIDVNTNVMDAMEVRLFGRLGLLAVHRGMQIRFYERPESPAERWPYREIYSFYTASEQGGLLTQDIDGDGYPDIICGNYWIRSPREFHLPWQLHAINLWNEDPLSASARLLWADGKLLWLESKRPKARASWFRPPADPRQLWIEEPLGLTLDRPRGLCQYKGEIWIGDRTRVFTLSDRRVRATGGPYLQLFPSPDGVVAVTSSKIGVVAT